MIRKLASGEYRLYSRRPAARPSSQRSSLEMVRRTIPFAGANRFSPRKRRNLGTFKSRKAAEKHERDVQYFKRH